MQPIINFFNKPFVAYEFGEKLTEQPFTFCRGRYIGVTTQNHLICHKGELDDKGIALPGRYHFLDATDKKWFFTDSTGQTLFISDLEVEKHGEYRISETLEKITGKANRIIACFARPLGATVVTQHVIATIKPSDEKNFTAELHAQPDDAEFISAHANGDHLLLMVKRIDNQVRGYFSFDLTSNNQAILHENYRYVAKDSAICRVSPELKLSLLEGQGLNPRWEFDLNSSEEDFITIAIQSVTDEYLAILHYSFDLSRILVLDRKTGVKKLEVQDNKNIEVIAARVFKDIAVIQTTKPSLVAYNIPSGSMICERILGGPIRDFYYGNGKLLVVQNDATIGAII